MSAMNAKFARHLPDKIHLIEEMWGRLSMLNSWDYDEIRTLHLRAHSLAGSAGTYGNAAVGEVARALALIFEKFLDGQAAIPNRALRARISDHVKALKAMALEKLH